MQTILRPRAPSRAVSLVVALWTATAAGQETTSQPAEREPTTNVLGLEAEPLTEPLVTDRPDFTESTLTVPFGHVQLETGYTFTYDDEGGQASTGSSRRSDASSAGRTSWA